MPNSVIFIASAKFNSSTALSTFKFFTVLKLIPVPDAIALSVFLVRFDGVLKWFLQF